jgi:thymidylate synthase
MHTLNVRNVHKTLPHVIHHACIWGDKTDNPTVSLPEPVSVRCALPLERVMFWPEEADCNPFCQLHDGLWMLAGRNDAAALESFGVDPVRTNRVVHDAYGFRWRHHFGIDQLDHIIMALRTDPHSEHCVLQTWSPQLDLVRPHPDVPTTTQIYFSRDEFGALNMMATSRAGDMVQAAYRGESVHLSMLQEYLAHGIGCDVGHYWHVHAKLYANRKEFTKLASTRMPRGKCPYAEQSVAPFPMFNTALDSWHGDLEMFMDCGMVLGIKDPFFRKVAAPVFQAFDAFNNNEGDAKYAVPLAILAKCAASDWRKACIDWLKRREDEQWGVA